MAGEAPVRAHIRRLVLVDAADAGVEARHEADVGEGAAEADRREVRRVAPVIGADVIVEGVVAADIPHEAQFVVLRCHLARI